MCVFSVGDSGSSSILLRIVSKQQTTQPYTAQQTHSALTLLSMAAEGDVLVERATTIVQLVLQTKPVRSVV